jgi:hypothetical protein
MNKTKNNARARAQVVKLTTVSSPKFLKGYLQEDFSGKRVCYNTKVHIVKHKIYYAIVG